MSFTRVRACVLVLALAWLAAPAMAASETCGSVELDNPVTGRTERVWTAYDGEDFEIYWAERIGGQWANETRLTDNGADDACPALAIAADGSSGVVWRASGTVSRIFYVGRKLVGEHWGWQPAPVPVSDGKRDAFTPRVSFHMGRGPHVVWCERDDDGAVHVMGGGDHSDPWPFAFVPTEIGMSTHAGPPELEINSRNGYLWTAWVDSTSQLGYAQFLSDWGDEQHTPYYGPSDVDTAKERLASTITSP